MKKKRFVVRYALDYAHVVQVGVEAADGVEAVAIAQKKFDRGTLWDDTPEMPLLYDDYEELDDNTLAFSAEEWGESSEPWPKKDASVEFYQRRDRALVIVKELVTALDNGRLPDEMESVFEAARSLCK